jgi:hypothetical protein
LEHWAIEFARKIQQRSEGQSDFALDLIDLLQQRASEFNRHAPDGFGFPVRVTPKGEDVEVTNGYKTVAVSSTSIPGAIFVRVSHHSNERGFEGSLHNTPDGFEADGIPSECADPSGLSEWMIHEIFEP